MVVLVVVVVWSLIWSCFGRILVVFCRVFSPFDQDFMVFLKISWLTIQYKLTLFGLATHKGSVKVFVGFCRLFVGFFVSTKTYKNNLPNLQFYRFL